MFFVNVFGFVFEFILNMLYILIDNKCIDILFEIVDEYVVFVNEECNVVDVIVYFICFLLEEEKFNIVEVFVKRMGKDVICVKNVVDEDLLGGIKVCIGNCIYDGSL